MKTAAFGLAVAALGLEMLLGQHLGRPMDTPLMPCGSGLSLVAAGFTLLLSRELSPFATRLAALILAASAVRVDIPHIIAAPADLSVWLAFGLLLALAASGRKLAHILDTGLDVIDAPPATPSGPEQRCARGGSRFRPSQA